MRVYCAGPMSGIKAFNIPAFDEAAADLRERGYDVVSPAELDNPEFREWCLASPDGDLSKAPAHLIATWGDLLARDVKLIADEGVQAIVCLDGWKESRGARLETFVARLCGLPVYEYGSGYLSGVFDHDINEAHGWRSGEGAESYDGVAYDFYDDFDDEQIRTSVSEPEPEPAFLGHTTGEITIGGSDVPEGVAGTTPDAHSGTAGFGVGGRIDRGRGVVLPLGWEVSGCPISIEHDRPGCGGARPDHDASRGCEAACAGSSQRQAPVALACDLAGGGGMADGNGLPAYGGAPTTEDPRAYGGATSLGAEVRLVDPITGGAKGQKLAQLGALDPLSLLEVGKVAGFGAQKYDRFNFVKGYKWSLSYDALQRHLLQWAAGEEADEESGLSHLGHAAWHCLALLTFTLRERGTDDRLHRTLEEAA